MTDDATFDWISDLANQVKELRQAILELMEWVKQAGEDKMFDETYEQFKMIRAKVERV